MAFLVFQLRAPLASWGAPAVGEHRGSLNYPGESSLLGLIGAALGLRREDDSAQASLSDNYDFAVGVLSSGKSLRDYHTIQVPPRVALKKRPHFTRKDELNVQKGDLKTIISKRDYRQEVSYLVALQACSDAPHSLDEIASALKAPRFVLYLGRKSCPLAAPLSPFVFETGTAIDAFDAYREKIGQLCGEEMPQIVQLAWSDNITAGKAPDLSVPRKDRVIRRSSWQFGDRTEHIAMIERE